MASMYVTEYSGCMVQSGGLLLPVPMLPAITTQKVTFTGTAGVTTNAFSAGTRLIGIYLDAAGFVLFGTAPTAVTATSPPHAANVLYFYGVEPSSTLKVSAVT